MTDTLGNNSQQQLKSIVERIEKLADEKDSIALDISDIYKEAGGNGFDVKALRAIIKLRAEDPEKRAQREAMIKTYRDALGL